MYKMYQGTLDPGIPSSRVDLCGKEQFMSDTGANLAKGDLCCKKYLWATAQAWIPATGHWQGATCKLYCSASEDILVCAHIGTTTLHPRMHSMIFKTLTLSC